MHAKYGVSSTAAVLHASTTCAGAASSNGCTCVLPPCRHLQLQNKLSEARSTLQNSVDPNTGKRLFHPETGRAPRFSRNTSQQPVSDYLYSLSQQQVRRGGERARARHGHRSASGMACTHQRPRTESSKTTNACTAAHTSMALTVCLREHLRQQELSDRCPPSHIFSFHNDCVVWLLAAG